jgi:hypothetical protein
VLEYNSWISSFGVSLGSSSIGPWPLVDTRVPVDVSKNSTNYEYECESHLRPQTAQKDGPLWTHGHVV